ncbi:MAG: hypothetical protein J5I64_13145 [Saprospiraceae bacterium]|nr:hypothetical protein [Saprospiraceae bacterium]
MKKLYKDTRYGIKAMAANPLAAWLLIREECRKLGINIPTQDEIVLVEDDSCA